MRGEARGVKGGAGVPWLGQRFPLRFSTKYTDAETGLLYYGYRYYSPSLGRWISRDPIEEQDGPNVMAFVGNRPTMATDPLGLRQVEFAFNAFINSRFGTWLPEPGSSGLTNGRFQFKTDNRPFGFFNFARDTHANARVYSVGNIESTKIGQDSSTSGSNGTGLSHRRHQEMRLDNQGMAYMEWVMTRRRAELTKNVFKEETTSKCQTTIHITASAAYPFLLRPLFAPNVDYDVYFVFRAKEDDTIDVEVWGGHNFFPDYEAYVDGSGPRSLLYLFSSPDSGPGLANLGFQWERFISTKKNIPGPVPKECRCNKQ